jgi:hypothetical protein
MALTIQTTWPQLKQMGGEFFRALPDATEEEAEQGFKCLTLGYFGLECAPHEQYQAEILLQLASRKLDERALVAGVTR